MKENEAPAKIYLDEDESWHLTNPNGDSVEYVRADAFIKKAVQYLKDHKEEIETEDNGIAGWIPDYFIEDFRKYMRGE